MLATAVCIVAKFAHSNEADIHCKMVPSCNLQGHALCTRLVLFFSSPLDSIYLFNPAAEWYYRRCCMMSVVPHVLLT